MEALLMLGVSGFAVGLAHPRGVNGLAVGLTHPGLPVGLAIPVARPRCATQTPLNKPKSIPHINTFFIGFSPSALIY